MITHDDEIAQVADRILVIEDGQVVDFRLRTISRIAYQQRQKRIETRSVLIMTAICLTTMLLVIISTVGNGMIRLTEEVRRQAHTEATTACLSPQMVRN